MAAKKSNISGYIFGKTTFVRKKSPAIEPGFIQRHKTVSWLEPSLRH
jgi:hypothetical protein